MTIEWHSIQLPCKFNLADPDELGIDATELELTRTAALGLAVTIVAQAAPPEVVAVAGTQVELVSVTLQTREHRQATLGGFRRGGSSTVREQDRTVSRITGTAESLSVSYSDEEAAATVEWIANLPKLVWPRLTERNKTSTSTRQREDEVATAESSGTSDSFDHARIHLGLPTIEEILIGEVNVSHLTDGTAIKGAGFIEFRRGHAGLPDESLRHTVHRAFEFLFGVGLGVLAHGEVSKDGQVVRTVVRSARVPGGFGSPFQPGLLHEDRINSLSEEVVAKLIRRYIELSSNYDLNRAVWLYLHARNAPLEMAAGYVGAAFELLPRGYYELPENKARSRLLPRSQWRQVAEALAAALATLKETNAGIAEQLASIEQGLSGLNKVSGSRLNSIFLTDLGLRTGDTERRALQARNDAAHANRLETSDFEALRAYRALHTLFARAMFALMGVEVRYFDYSCDGFPVKPLLDPQGAPTAAT